MFAQVPLEQGRNVPWRGKVCHKTGLGKALGDPRRAGRRQFKVLVDN